jgi:hypothetical protein
VDAPAERNKASGRVAERSSTTFRCAVGHNGGQGIDIMREVAPVDRSRACVTGMYLPLNQSCGAAWPLKRHREVRRPGTIDRNWLGDRLEIIVAAGRGRPSQSEGKGERGGGFHDEGKDGLCRVGPWDNGGAATGRLVVLWSLVVGGERGKGGGVRKFSAQQLS